MFVRYLLLLLAGIIWTAEGALSFEKEPDSPVYSMVGSDAFIEWTYPEAIKATELKSVVWSARNKTDGEYYVLIVDNLERVSENPNIPLFYRNRVDKTKQATLVIKSVAIDDSTKFLCKLRSKQGSSFDKTSQPVELVVTGRASVDPKVQLAELGGSATFTCNATNVPSQNISWIRQGQITQSSQLTVKDISEHDYGYYICNATLSGNHTNIATAYLQRPYLVEVKGEEAPRRSFNVTRNETQSICCPVTGFPPPIVTWEKNGIQLQKGENICFTITPVRDEDFGNYTCTATDFKTSLGPITISVKPGAQLVVDTFDGTDGSAGRVNWTEQGWTSDYYVVNVKGNDILDDLVYVGRQTSLELHYHALVKNQAAEMPETTQICAGVSAIKDEAVLEAPPECLTLVKPADTKH